MLGDVGAGHDVRATVAVECKAMYRQDGPVELRPLGETEFLAAAAWPQASWGMLTCAWVQPYAPCCRRRSARVRVAFAGSVTLRSGTRTRPHAAPSLGQRPT
jgi:hypothetical protein